jgi:hypothetical protein
VQQGIWDTALESMPLAIGYMKAAADADDTIRSEMDIRLFNFKGNDSALSITRRLLFDEIPEIMAFSIRRPFVLTVEAALTESNGRVAGPDGAAVRLGMSRSTLE